MKASILFVLKVLALLVRGLGILRPGAFDPTFADNLALLNRHGASPANWGGEQSQPGAVGSRIGNSKRQGDAQHVLSAASPAMLGATTPGGTPSQAVPKRYDLTVWEPDSPASSTFAGRVVMDLEIVEDTTTLFLHAENITFQEWSLRVMFPNGTKATRHGPDEIKLDPPNADGVNHVTLHFGFSVPAGSSVQTNILYHGVVWPRGVVLGLFENQIDPENPAAGTYYSTQSEESGTRRILPCLDEPHWKANFTVNLVVKESHVGRSNMQIASETAMDGGLKKVAFHTTPPMSTYLLTIGMGNIAFHEIENDFRLPLRAYVPGWVDPKLTDYPLRLTAMGLGFFERLLGVQMPLLKVDWWAMSLSWGAIEDWGMVVIGLEDFAMDLDVFDVTQQQSNAWFFLHELAHFWFGDLVTCEWWNNIWLNEGFSTYFSYLAVQNLFPNVDIEPYHILDSRQSAMSGDLGSAAHALEIPLDYLGENFDVISYQKGSSVLRMMSAYMGQDEFIARVGNYLARYQFGTANTKDFVDSLGDGAWGMWEPWVRTPGHPYVLVNETDDGEISLTQVHRVGNTEGDVTFPTPLLIKTDEGLDRTSVMFQKTQKLPAGIGKSGFFFLNADGAGFYRVGYTPELLAKLVDQSHKLSPSDLTALIADSFALCSEEIHLNAGDVVELISAIMDRNDNYCVWKTAHDTLRSLADAFSDSTDIVETLDELIRDKTAARVERMGWTKDYWKATRENIDIAEDDLSVRFKTLTLYELGMAGEPGAIEAASEIMEALVSDGMAAAGGNAWKSALWVAIRQGGKAEWDSGQALFDAVPNYQAVKLGLAQALGRTTVPSVVEDTMALLTRPDITAFDPFLHVTSAIMQGVGANPAAVAVASAWARDNWDGLLAYGEFPTDHLPGMRQRVFTALAAKAKTKDEVSKWKSWLETADLDGSLEATIRAALDGAVDGIEWAQRNIQTVRKALGLI